MKEEGFFHFFKTFGPLRVYGGRILASRSMCYEGRMYPRKAIT